MPGRKIDVIEEVKKKYVRMALETGRQASIARKAGISSKTLRKWIREYEGEIREAMESEESPTLPDQPIYHRRYAEFAFGAIQFGNFHPFNGDGRSVPSHSEASSFSRCFFR